MARKGKASVSSNGQVAPGIAPSQSVAQSRAYASWWKVWLPIPFLLLFLDLSFNSFFWRLPKLTGPDADWGYQFLLDVHRAQEPKPEHARRIVAFGSSVSGSFDPLQVAGLLSASAGSTPFDVHRLMLPGVHPADYRLFWEGEVERIRPDVAVILVNLLDFLTSSNEKDMNPALLAALPPWRTLEERGAMLSTTEKLDWALRGVSHLYRYSKVMRSSLQDHLKALPHLVRGGATDYPYGIFPDGYTRPQFAVPVKPGAAFDFEYRVDPEWLHQRGKVTLTFSAAQRVLAEVAESEPGWKQVHLEIPAEAKILTVSADGFWSRRVAGESGDLRLVGAQLRLPLADGIVNERKAPWHYPPYDRSAVHELLRLDGSVGYEFARKWQAMVAADNEFGKRIRVYRDEKVATRTRTFEVTGEFRELETLVGNLSQRGVAVVLINTPDSPWILQEYQDSPYYQAYLKFFSDLADRHSHVRFTDLRRALPVEDFNDWHHPNYFGAIKLGPLYAEAIRKVSPGEALP